MRVVAGFLAVLLISCGSKQSKKPASAPQASVLGSTAAPNSASAKSAAASYTEIVIHNLILHQSTGLKVNVRWLRGRMYATKPNVYPSFDEPGSFVLDIEDGLIGSSLADLTSALNSGMLRGSPLEKISLSGQGKQITLRGTLHKGIPLPIEMIGELSPSSNGDKIRIHVTKLEVLKIPVKGFLGALKIQTAELIDPKGGNGIQATGDDIEIDPSKLLPPPRNIGKLTDIHFAKNGDLVEVYGSARPDVTRFKQWRNFMRLRGGTLKFGKLAMQDADILVVDTSQADWFNFDLAHYEEQLVNGDVRITPQAGLQIFMPDINKIPKTKANQSISMQWVKNRNAPPPPDVP